MTTMRTRASKGSELTHGEGDANFVRDVDILTTTYSCLVSDNRSTKECNHATTAFTVTLGDAATMAAAETGDYEVTVTNIGAAVVTIARAGSDTINGGSTSITLKQYSSVTLKVNAATDGYNIVTPSYNPPAITTVTYGTTCTIDLDKAHVSTAAFYRIDITDTVAFSVALSGNYVAGQEIHIMMRNASGGSMGTATADAELLATSFGGIANGSSVVYTFRAMTSSVFIQTNIGPAVVY